MLRGFPAGGVGLALAGVAGVAGAGTPVQWSVEVGGNGAYYERVDTTGTLTWEQARDAAAALSFNGVPGHLVVFDNVQYQRERTFVDQSVRGNLPYLDCYWVGAFRASNVAASNRQGWVWVDGTSIPTSITNGWYIDQNEGQGDEGAVLYALGAEPGDYGTADQLRIAKGYLVEYGNAAAAMSGDANFNGRIDADDFAAIDHRFGKHLTGWANGDFNNDNVVNGADYTLLYQAFAAQGGMYDASGLFVAIPEPVSFAGVGVVGVLLTRRRSRGRGRSVA